MVLTWALYYMFKSIEGGVQGGGILPWATCNNSWNTEHCVTNFSQHTALIGKLYLYEYDMEK